MYFKGLFGNKLLSWDSLEDYYIDLEKELAPEVVALRTKTVPGIVLPNYCKPTSCSSIEKLVNEWSAYGIKRTDILINEIGQDNKIVIQGEVMQSVNYLSLRYTTVKTIMRHAFKMEELHAEGFQAVSLLKTHMDTPSFENLNHLLDIYVGAVIEFSTYSRAVGDLNWNTVFWEVRHY